MPEPPPLGGDGRAGLRLDKVLSLIPRLFTDDLTGKIAVNRGRWLSGRGLIGQGPFTHNGGSPLSLDSVIGPVGADDRV